MSVEVKLKNVRTISAVGPKPASPTQISYAKALIEQGVRGLRGVPAWLDSKDVPTDEQLKGMDGGAISILIDSLKARKPFEVERYSGGGYKVVRKAARKPRLSREDMHSLDYIRRRSNGVWSLTTTPDLFQAAVRLEQAGLVRFEPVFNRKRMPNGHMIYAVDGASSYKVARSFGMKLALDTKKWGPFVFEIDRPKGFKKEWPQEDGSVKKYTYPVDYGYFVGHTGEDEEGLDAFVGSDPEGAIESFLKMKPSDEDDGKLVPDETKFLIGLSDSERKKVLDLYKPEEIVGLRKYEDVYELVAVLNAFRDKKAAARLASRFLEASQKAIERDRKATHFVVRDVHGVREYLNNTDPPGGWTKRDYLAIPFELPRAQMFAEKFGGEVAPRKTSARRTRTLAPGDS